MQVPQVNICALNYPKKKPTLLSILKNKAGVSDEKSRYFIS